MIKILSKLGIEENFLNLRKTIYKKPTTNFILSETLKAFTLKSGTGTGCFLPTLVNIILEILTNAIRHDKEKNGIKFRKEVMKLSLFLDYMIIYVENPRVNKKIPSTNK